jgi:hypothetical protein
VSDLMLGQQGYLTITVITLDKPITQGPGVVKTLIWSQQCLKDQGQASHEATEVAQQESEAVEAVW